MNTFGTLFRFTDFGESHGTAIGGVIDGMPAGFAVDLDAVQAELDRRRPGQSSLTTQRKEADRITVLSGIYEGRTLGTPIGFTIANSDQHSSDYENMRHVFRPGHADFTYAAKYGHRDHRGGGRASARETAVRVAAGAFARQVLAAQGITVSARAAAIGGVNLLTAPQGTAEKLIEEAKFAGDTLGGIVACSIKGVPAGLGEPIFGKLQTMLASAMMSINAAHGFDYGDGFDMAARRGSEVIDNFIPDGNGGITTAANHSGGIQGGISNGAEITFRVAFKPIATMMRPVDTVDDCGQPATLQVRGRHDVCVVPRAVPVVEAMAAVTVLDALMLRQSRRF